jgi:hypothetical protein
MVIKGFPLYEAVYKGEKARFKRGDLVTLPSLFGGKPIFDGIVVGKGKDKYGEYQKVKIVYYQNEPKKVGMIQKVRLMDLAWLWKFGEVSSKEIPKMTTRKLRMIVKRLEKVV